MSRNPPGANGGGGEGGEGGHDGGSGGATVEEQMHLAAALHSPALISPWLFR